MGKASSESEMGHVPNFEILVHLTWNDPIVTNQSNDATESQKRRPVLILIFSTVSQKLWD